MLDVQLILFGPVAYLVNTLAFVPEISQHVHQKAEAGGGCQGVYNIDLSFRITFPGDQGRAFCGAVGAGNAAGKTEVKDVFSFT